VLPNEWVWTVRGQDDGPRRKKNMSLSIRLTQKIMAIGVIGLIGLVAFAAIYRYGSASQDRSRVTAAGARAIAELNQHIANEMLEARRAEKDFQLRHDPAFAKRQQEVSAAVSRDLGQLQSLIRSEGLGDIVDRLDLAQRGFDDYVREFGAVAESEVKLGLNETLGLSGSLRSAVHDIEAKLKESDEPRLTVWMLMMRRHEKDFMLRRDIKYVGELKKAAAEFSKILATTETTPAVKADIVRKLEQYQADFVAWADGAQEAARHDAAMSAAFKGVEPVIAEIQQGVERRYREAEVAETTMRDAVGRWMLIAFVLAVLMANGTSFWIGRSISKVLSAMVEAMTRLAGGDLTVAIPGLGRKDEMGEMAAAMEVFEVNMTQAERLRAEQQQAEQRQMQERTEAVQQMASIVERETSGAVGEVSAETDRMAANAARMSDSAAILAQNSGSVAAAAEQALANSRTLTAAAAQLNSSIAEIAAKVTSSRALTSEAVAASGKAQATIAKLSEAAGKVGAVTSLIAEIASQTNLLALNATIEAARAGDAGRGFAVVASEVKSLAEQTAKATSEIAQQIEEIQRATHESVEAINAIGAVIRNVEANASMTAEAMDKQNVVTREISQTVEESSAASREVAAQIVNVSNEAIETGKRATQIRDGATEIAGKVDGLRTTLVRVVRTSTVDADRREFVRHEIECQGRVEIRGISHQVVVRDLSERGARIDRVIPGALDNMPLVLEISGLPVKLDGVIVRLHKDTTSIKFNLSDAATTAVRAMLESRRAA